MALHDTSGALVIFLVGLVVQTQAESPEVDQLEKFIVDDGRIVGGIQTTTEDFPWQLFVMMQRDAGTYVCGGSIISESWSMSAAHCFASARTDGQEGFEVTARKIFLYAGATDKYALSSDPDVQSQTFEEAEYDEYVFIHPEYKIGATYNNDITIFKMKEPWTLTDKVSPIALATTDDFIVGKQLTVSGWGKTCPTCSTSGILLYVAGLNLISRERCANYWGASRITDNMICHESENANTCGGDSGGPVITGSGASNGPPYVQTGIVSWGSSDCGAFVPKVFVDVAKYRTWIDDTMSGGSSNSCDADTSSKCAKWVKRGKCKKAKIFWQCKSSCACGTGSNAPCKNTKRQCSKWAAQGKCSQKKVYTKCRSSCACAAGK